jgi:hypothetical protein
MPIKKIRWCFEHFNFVDGEGSEDFPKMVES